MTSLLLVLLAVTPPVAAPKPPAAPPPVAAREPDPVRRAVVSLKVTGQEYDWKAPWGKLAPWTRACTGLVVPGKLILVTSDCVGNATLVEVQKLGEERRYGARVKLADHEGALALVESEENELWQGLVPLPLAADAPLDGDVTVHRWLASNQFETARGNVRQVRSEDHGYGRVPLLTLDVTSNIQGGGTGEVLMARGEVVGISSSKADDVLLAIASPVLRQFLEGARRAPYPGFARHGFASQKLLNPALRRALGMRPEEAGVLVNRVLPQGSAATALEPNDVVMAIDGFKIDASGQVDHPRYGKQFFGLLLTLGHFPGDSVDVKVLRKGERRTVKMKLVTMPPQSDKIPAYVVDQPPDYLVRGGLVFQNLTYSYLATFGDWRRRAALPLTIATDLEAVWPTPGEPRLVILTNVLPDPVNLGYQDERDAIVSAVDGHAVGTLDDVKKALDGPPPDGRFHIVEFRQGQNSRRMVLDAAEMNAADARIRERYGMPAEP